ncbi:MAG: hypothetical protein ACR2PS_03060 [Pseudomonadales bacterium]
MSTQLHQHAKLRQSIQRSTEASRAEWRRYRATHGPMSLATHIFMSTPTQGFPVMVKSHSDKQVRCRILQSGEEFTVGMAEYEAHRGRDFLLDSAQEKKDPEAFKKQSQWFRDAYKAAGISIVSNPELERCQKGRLR